MGLGIKTALLRPFEPLWRYRLPQYRAHRHGDLSQHGESLLIWPHVSKAFPRFIVDVGANDGRRNSNSYFFLQRGWSGILIEPNPVVFQKLAMYYQNQPTVRCVNVGCSDKAGVLPLFLGADGEAAEFSTLSRDDNDYFRRTRTEEAVEVQVKKLTDVLTENDSPPEIGILSVDVETFDLEVLKGLDFSKFRPRIIITESYASKDPEKFKLLEQNGYTFWKRRGVNTIWRQT